MLKTILVLPNGTEVSSGAGMVNAIQSVTLTECVNDSEELTLGSTCSNALEATLITPAGGLVLDAGAEVVVHKEIGGVRQQIGVFTLEKPTRPSANTMKITGYDRVSKLDKDLTAWLSGLTGWPYALNTFANMVCDACGLTFKVTDVPNGDFPIYQFTRSSVTGRQLMQWLGEICCRFCRADLYGEIEFAWYTDSGKEITTGGELYYFYNSLSYEDYTTVAIEAVQIRMADSENGALWPAAEDGVNSYIITGNPILNLRITEDLVQVLANIEAALKGVRYTPCKVSVPANLDIRAGNTVTVTDKNGKTFTAYVMTKTQKGQKDTLECTGSHRRDTPAAVNNQSEAAAAQKALDNMTFEDFIMKLTKEGKIKGMFVKDGELYFNASYIVTGTLLADLISGTLGKDGKLQIDLSSGNFKLKNSEGTVIAEIYEDSKTGGCLEVNSNSSQIYQARMFANSTDGAKVVVRGEADMAGIRVNTKNGQGMYAKGELFADKITVYDDPVDATDVASWSFIYSYLVKNFSPAGYGLGGNAKVITNPDDATVGGIYRIYDKTDNMPFNFMILLSMPYYNDGVQIGIQWTSGVMVTRHHTSSAGWSEWEYINPPMVAGTEYRTTERWNGKVVYTRLINCGAMPNNTNVNINCLVKTWTVIDFEVVFISDYLSIKLPHFDASGKMTARAICNTNSSVIQIMTTTDMSSYTGYATIKYTKD